MMDGAIRTSIKTNGGISGTMEVMAILMQLEKDSRAKGSKAKEKDSIKEKAKARHQDSMGNATHAVHMGIRRGFAHKAMENPRAKERNRQYATSVAIRDISQPIVLKAK